MIGEIDEILKHGPGPGHDARAIGAQRGLAESQHKTAEALVGNDQVGAAAGDTNLGAALPGGGKGSDERLLVACLGKQIGRSANAEPGVAGQRSAGRNS